MGHVAARCEAGFFFFFFFVFCPIYYVIVVLSVITSLGQRKLVALLFIGL